MLAGLRIELRHGSSVARALVRARLQREHAEITDGPGDAECVIVDLDGCGTCPKHCPSGPLILVEHVPGVNVSTSVPVDRVSDELVEAILMVARAARLLPDANHDPPSRRLADLLLSEREWQVVRGVVEGKSNKMIARELGITETTVKVHMKSILRKTGTVNRTQTALWAVRHTMQAG